MATELCLGPPPPRLPTADSTTPQPAESSFDFITRASRDGTVDQTEDGKSIHPGKQRNKQMVPVVSLLRGQSTQHPSWLQVGQFQVCECVCEATHGYPSAAHSRLVRTLDG